jgi:hypothetical protein
VVKRAKVSEDRIRQPHAEKPIYGVLQEDVPRILEDKVAHRHFSTGRETDLRVRFSLGLFPRLILRRCDWTAVGPYTRRLLRRFD